MIVNPLRNSQYLIELQMIFSGVHTSISGAWLACPDVQHGMSIAYDGIFWFDSINMLLLVTILPSLPPNRLLLNTECYFIVIIIWISHAILQAFTRVFNRVTIPGANINLLEVTNKSIWIDVSCRKLQW